MPTDCITYQESGYFSRLIIDYLNQNQSVKSYYNRFPSKENFLEQIKEKTNNYPDSNRKILVDSLLKQNNAIDLSLATHNNIKLLLDSNTFTITTGHQLNLFTGHLYFVYKIVSTINLCKQLKKEYPDFNFVPIYWMATEDHDFEEINHFEFKRKKITWNKQSSGPVGRLSTDGLQEVYETFATELGLSENANYLKDLFQKSYLEHSNLADATRFLVNELFKKEGLVIMDGDDAELKKLFIPTIKKELREQFSHKEITNTLTNFNYEIQVNPREINLFYIEDNLRERIIFDKGKYIVNNTNHTFSETEILDLVEKNPEKFSPNVVLRPLYQEIILPNLCYIGGGGEIAYWLELKEMFQFNQTTFPILLLRNSVLIATEKQKNKIATLDLTWSELFQKQENLINLKTKEFSNFTIDFSEQKEVLKNQFNKLEEIALQTDKSFIGAVKAQQAKQIKGLENLEKRLLKAEKRIHQDKLKRIVQIQEELFPNQTLQERKLNFSEFYTEFGQTFFTELFDNLHPLENQFSILTYKS